MANNGSIMDSIVADLIEYDLTTLKQSGERKYRNALKKLTGNPSATDDEYRVAAEEVYSNMRSMTICQKFDRLGRLGKVKG